MIKFDLFRQHTFIPSLYEAAGLILLSIATLSTLTIIPIIRNINSESYEFFSTKFASTVSEQLEKLNTPRMTTILTFVLWCMVGALAYILIWAITSLYKSYKEDISAFSGLIIPTGYQKKVGLGTHLTRIYIRTMALVGLVFWILFFFVKVLPNCVNQFVAALTNVDALSIVAILLAVLYVAASMFILIVLIRLVLLRRRIFSSNQF